MSTFSSLAQSSNSPSRPTLNYSGVSVSFSLAQREEILRDSMVEAGQVYLKNVPVVVDVSVVGNWAEK